MKMLVYLNDYKQLFVVLCLWLIFGFAATNITAVAQQWQ
jgi:hypothetical protein